MPGESGSRRTGDVPRASDPCSRVSGDTPYDDAIGPPMTNGDVGGTT